MAKLRNRRVSTAHRGRLLLALCVLTLPGGLRAQGIPHEVTGDGVRLREGPSTQAGIMATLARGTQVMVLDQTGDWARVQYRSQTGYMSTQFLRPLAPPPPPPQAQTPATPVEEPPPRAAAPAAPRPPAAAARPVLRGPPPFSLFAGGSVGGSGYGNGFVAGGSVSVPLGSGSGVRVMVDGSYSRFARTEAGGGPEDVKLTMLAGAGSLVIGLSPMAPIEPFLLAGSGAYRATAKAPADGEAEEAASSESTWNGGAHVGGGIRIGRMILEARYIRLKGFAPVNLRFGFGF